MITCSQLITDGYYSSGQIKGKKFLFVVELDRGVERRINMVKNKKINRD